MRAFAMAITVALCACSSAKTIPLPNGGRGYVIENCREADCYRRAAQLCPNYELVNASKGAQGMVTGGNAFVVPRVSLVIRCP